MKIAIHDARNQKHNWEVEQLCRDAATKDNPYFGVTRPQVFSKKYEGELFRTIFYKDKFKVEQHEIESMGRTIARTRWGARRNIKRFIKRLGLLDG